MLAWNSHHLQEGGLPLPLGALGEGIVPFGVCDEEENNNKNKQKYKGVSGRPCHLIMHFLDYR